MRDIYGKRDNSGLIRYLFQIYKLRSVFLSSSKLDLERRVRSKPKSKQQEMAGIMEKIGEKLHIGGGGGGAHKDEKHHDEKKKHDQHHGEHKEEGLIEKIKDKIHGDKDHHGDHKEHHGTEEKKNKKNKKDKKNKDDGGHSSSDSDSD